MRDRYFSLIISKEVTQPLGIYEDTQELLEKELKRYNPTAKILSQKEIILPKSMKFPEGVEAFEKESGCMCIYMSDNIEVRHCNNVLGLYTYFGGGTVKGTTRSGYYILFHNNITGEKLDIETKKSIQSCKITRKKLKEIIG